MDADEWDERDNRGDASDGQRDAASATLDEEEPQPLARARYGLGKELLLYPDVLVVHLREEHERTGFNLDTIRRLILLPGEHIPSKLVLMVELDDGNTVIVAEGVSNVRALRVLLARLKATRPEIELDPDDMDEQLAQALDIRRRYSLGCYAAVFASCLLIWLVYLVVAFIGARGPH